MLGTLAGGGVVEKNVYVHVKHQIIIHLIVRTLHFQAEYCIQTRLALFTS